MTDGGAPSLRQRKHTATAQSIERSAVALVLEQGIDAVTVDMICEAAGVSQRTFFNYFKTKDAAILGAAPPKLDERRVREFLASDSPELLRELLALIRTLAPIDFLDRDLAADRMRIIAQSPSYLHKEMGRLFEMREELEEILYLRLRRSALPAESAADTRDQAALITHVVAGVMRFLVEQTRNAVSDPASDGRAGESERVERLLAAALGKLLPAP